MSELDGIFAAQSDQHAVTLAVQMAGNLLSEVPNSTREAKLLLAHVTGKSLHDLGMADMTSNAMELLIAACDARNSGTPMSHLLGRRDFWTHQFIVTPDVFLVSLLAERRDALGVGVDASEAAIGVARRNAQAIGVAERSKLLASDWFEAVDGTFDLIVSNPPYIAQVEMAGLERELSHEPRMALTDEGDGLSCYRAITAQAWAYLAPGGWLMVEIGPTQARAVCAMFEAAGLGDVAIRCDLDGRDRVILGKKAL